LLQRSTHVDGVEIIERRPAEGPHPHPRFNGKIVSITHANHLLLADERELYECDHCGWRHVNLKSVVSHMPAHSPTKNAPDYPVDVLRTLVQLVRDFESQHVRGKCEKTAAELNRRGVPRRDGRPWNGQNVSQLYRTHMDKFRNRPSRSLRPPQPQPQPQPDLDTQTPTTTVTSATETADVAHAPDTAPKARRPRRTTHVDLETQTRALATRAAAAALHLAQLEHDLLELADRVAVASAHADSQVLEKAEKWDQMQKLMNR